VKYLPSIHVAHLVESVVSHSAQFGRLHTGATGSELDDELDELDDELDELDDELDEILDELDDELDEELDD